MDLFTLHANIRKARQEYFRLADLHGPGSIEATQARETWHRYEHDLWQLHARLRAIEPQVAGG